MPKSPAGTHDPKMGQGINDHDYLGPPPLQKKIKNPTPLVGFNQGIIEKEGPRFYPVLGVWGGTPFFGGTTFFFFSLLFSQSGLPKTVVGVLFFLGTLSVWSGAGGVGLLSGKKKGEKLVLISAKNFELI